MTMMRYDPFYSNKRNNTLMFGYGQPLAKKFKPQMKNANNVSYTRTKKRKRFTGNSFQSRVLAVTGTNKHSLGQTSTSGLLHNSLYTLGLTQPIVQGTSGTGTRIGDSIRMIGLHLRGTIYTELAAAAYSYRLMIVLSGEEYNLGTSAWSSGLGASELFQPGTTALSYLGTSNKKAITVLFDKSFDINSNLDGFRDVTTFDEYIPLNNKLMQYQADGSIYGKNQSLYAVLCTNVAAGITAVTPAGACVMSTDLIYK